MTANKLQNANGSVFSEGSTVCLRTTEEADIEFLRANSNDPRIRRAMIGDGPTNSTELRDIVRDDSTENYHFIIATRQTNESVGYVALRDVNSIDGIATLSFWVTPSEWSNGYGSEAVELVVEFGFQQLRLHKIRADVREFNEASQYIFAKLGFTQEGVLRESRFVDGKYWDRYRYGILRDEWGEPDGDHPPKSPDDSSP